MPIRIASGGADALILRSALASSVVAGLLLLSMGAWGAEPAPSEGVPVEEAGTGEHEAEPSDWTDPPWEERTRPPLMRRLIGDYRAFYSGMNGAYLTMGFMVGAVVANSEADELAQDWWQDIRTPRSDEIAAAVKHFGDGEIMIPVYVGAALVFSDYFHWNYLGPFDRWLAPLGEWGERSSRAVALGAPPLLLMQRVTGASRPWDGNGSKWNFWNDANGVSGHAFMGAIPFLTMADMTNRWWAKVIFYGASGLTAWSRINDDAHYTSQAFLGWFLAYRSVRSVTASERDVGPALTVLPMGDGAMLFYSRSF